MWATIVLNGDFSRRERPSIYSCCLLACLCSRMAVSNENWWAVNLLFCHNNMVAYLSLFRQRSIIEPALRTAKRAITIHWKWLAWEEGFNKCHRQSMKSHFLRFYAHTLRAQQRERLNNDVPGVGVCFNRVVHTAQWNIKLGVNDIHFWVQESFTALDCYSLSRCACLTLVCKLLC
jgi:hypothetical protein